MLRMLALAMVTAAALAAQPQKFTVDTSTPEGQMLQTAGQTEDKAARIKLYEEYLAKFPQHAGVGWVCSLLTPLYFETGQHDKALETAARGLALDPANAVMAHKALQACEAKKDAACVKDWSAKTAEAAQKALAVKKPDDEDEAETWKREVDFAKQVIVYTEYALYAAVLTSADPKVKIDMGETLEKRNPKSQYMGMAAGPYFVALLQTGQAAPAAALVDRAAAGGYSNEDMLLFAADYQMQQKEFGKALGYAGKLIAELPAKAAPQGVSAADWEAKKNGTLARAHYMTGSVECTQSKWAECDQAMRAALPLAQNNNDLLPGVYFYLGWANHELAKAGKDKVRRAEARKYFEACAKLKSPFQTQAIKNLNAIVTSK